MVSPPSPSLVRHNLPCAPTLQVGLVNGVLLRTEVDRVTGQLRCALGACDSIVTARHSAPAPFLLAQSGELRPVWPMLAHPCQPTPSVQLLECSDTRTRFLGTKPPKLFAAPVRGERSMLALSSRPW